MVPFEAEKFRPFMESTVRPFIDTEVHSGEFPGYDGNTLHYYSKDHPDPKGIIVMMHGFCGFFGKYHEVVYNFYEQGYSFYFLEHRGHGLSYRPVKDPCMVDITDFDEYVEDLKCFLDKVVLPVRDKAAVKRGKAKLPLFVYAHSMGGCVATMFLEKYPDVFDGAVLSSPMLKINFGTIPLWKMKLIALFTKLAGWNDRYVPGQGPFSGKPEFEESGASSPERYQYSFEMRAEPGYGGRYTMNGASCRWARASLRATLGLDKKEGQLDMPILILQAGRDTYVMNPAEDQLARTAKHAKLVSFPEAKHEIFNTDGAVLGKYYQAIFDFLAGCGRPFGS